MKAILAISYLLIFSCVCNAQTDQHLLTFPDLDPDYRYTFNDLDGRKALELPFPSIKSILNFEAKVSFSIRPDGWIEQIDITYPPKLDVNHKRKIIRTMQKWRFTPYSTNYNHPTHVGIWFYHDNMVSGEDWMKTIMESAHGLNDRKLIYAPYPLPAKRSDTISVDLEINRSGEVTQLKNIHPLTPTYRSTELLKHRVAQVVRRWKFEPLQSAGNQWITVFVLVDGRR